MTGNENIVSILKGKNSLLDTNLIEINIKNDENGEVSIILAFSNFRKTSDFKTIRIEFSEVEEFHFGHNSNHHFYNVESYKLLIIDNKTYISLDPADSTNFHSSEDLDYILAGSARIVQ